MTPRTEHIVADPKASYKYIRVPVDEIYAVLEDSARQELEEVYEIVNSLERRVARLESEKYELEQELGKYSDLKAVAERKPYGI